MIVDMDEFDIDEFDRLRCDTASGRRLGAAAKPQAGFTLFGNWPLTTDH
jgi:hypothetical protein